MDIKILVATHKPYWMPEDKVYVPIHMGSEGKTDIGFIGDNTGENISNKNANYCELTGLYWAWKNLQADYIGLCHYRRYFANKHHGNSLASKQKAILSKKDYEALLKDYECILPGKRNYYIVRRQIKAFTNCIPKSNYNYKSNDCLAINCILKVHIIPIKNLLMS